MRPPARSRTAAAVLLALLLTTTPACGGSGDARRARTRPTDRGPALLVERGQDELALLGEAAAAGFRRATAGDPRRRTEVTTRPDGRDAPDQANNLAADDWDPVIGVGPSMGEVMREAARNYPDTVFVLIGGLLQPGPAVPDNLRVITFDERGAVELAGALAAALPGVTSIGIVGAAPTLRIRMFNGSLQIGSTRVNPKIGYQIRYVTSMANLDQVNDVERAAGLARNMATDRAGVVAYMGAGAKDVVSAIAESDAASGNRTLVIGSTVDTARLVPEQLRPMVLTSAVHHYDVAVELAVRRADGLAPTTELGLADGGVGITTDNPIVAGLLADPVTRSLVCTPFPPSACAGT